MSFSHKTLLVGLGGPDWCALVENNVAIVLNSTDDGAVAGRAGRIGLPDSVAFVVTTHRVLVRHNTAHYTTTRAWRKKKRGVSLLHAQVAVSLHIDALDVVPLMNGILELALAAPIHGDLAIDLHLELDRAVLAKQAVAHKEPLAVTEGVMMRHIDCILENTNGGLFQGSKGRFDNMNVCVFACLSGVE